MARKSTLADRFVHRTRPYDRIFHRDAMERIRNKVFAAKKFVFDEEASYRAGLVRREDPRLVIREHSYAMPPYPLTWIEFHHDQFWEASTGQKSDAPEDERDSMVAYLLSGNHVSLFIGGTVGNPLETPFFTGLGFLLNTEVDEAERRQSDDITKANGVNALDMYFWGRLWNELTEAERAFLRYRHTIVAMELAPPYTDRQDEHYREVLQGGSGELSIILTMLIMLNRPTVTLFDTAPRVRVWIGNKPKALLEHVRVRVAVEAPTILRQLGTPSGADIPSRRLHPVKGFWRHNREAHEYARVAGCVHDWAPTLPPSEGWEVWHGPVVGFHRHWMCTECGGKRWWVDDHQRGSLEAGEIVHDGYDVHV